MNVFEVLKQDHQKAREIFSKIAATSNGAKKTREQLFQQLKRELLAHAHAEEKHFYPMLKNKEQVGDMIKEGISEHHEVEKKLKDIEKMSMETDEWLSSLKELQESVEHHVEEEEGEIFPKAQKILEAKQVDELGDKVKEYEAQERKAL
jgi:hemerythrin superfamily protein